MEIINQIVSGLLGIALAYLAVLYWYRYQAWRKKPRCVECGSRRTVLHNRPFAAERVYLCHEHHMQEHGLR